MKRLIVLPLLFLLGCQDHHFIPIEEAGDMSEPKFGSEEAAKGFSQQGAKAQKEVLSEAYRGDKKPKETGGLIVSGQIDLGEKQKGRDYSNFSIYIIAWKAEKSGAPLAVGRYKVKKFPFTYTLSERDLMTANFPTSSTDIALEARLDGDGDPVTKETGDVYGFSEGKFKIGSRGIDVTLNKFR